MYILNIYLLTYVIFRLPMPLFKQYTPEILLHRLKSFILRKTGFVSLFTTNTTMFEFDSIAVTMETALGLTFILP